jgi:hypothetical protein
VRYNISQNDKGDLIFFNYPSAGNEIYNNVFYIGAGLSPNIIHESSKEHTYNFFNNIIYNLSSTADYSFKLTGQTRTISHNVFYGYHPGGDATLAEPADAYKLTSDPLFVSPGTGTTGLASLTGYKLQSTSPAINSGRSITANGGKDFWGNTLYTGNPDRGSFEYPTLLARVSNSNRFFRESDNIAFDHVVLYPNPATESIRIDLNKSVTEFLWIHVSDLTGQRVRIAPINSSKVTLALSGLPAGIYVLSIRDEKGRISYVQNFLKQ